jgi:hypothetical protein
VKFFSVFFVRRLLDVLAQIVDEEKQQLGVSD